MDYILEAKKVIDTEIEALRALQEQIDEGFARAIEWILETVSTGKKIVISGIGKSGHIGRKVAATFVSTGLTAVFLDPVEAMHGDLGMISDGDLVFMFSYSGESDEVVALLPALKRFDIRLVAITGHLSSTLARYADLVLSVRVPKEACPFNLAPTSSTTAMLALGDALVMTSLQARGLKREDFARYHPGGAIGRTLLLRARDIMRKGDRLPLAPPSVTIQEALVIMTRAKAGCVIAVDSARTLKGIFTDGDLRRHLQTEPALLSKPLEQFMTRHPVAIQEDALAVEVLRVFNQQAIDDLVVIDADGKVVGLIDSQDLPKLKLM